MDAFLQQARALGDVGESAIAVVAIEDVLAVIRDEDVFVAVIVVIADGDGLGPAGADEAGFFRHVTECAVAIVFVEAIGDAGRNCGCIEAAAVEDQDVEPAVVIVIEEGDAAACAFENIVGMIGGAEDDGVGETGFRSNVCELREEWNAGGFGAGLGLDTARG